MSKESYAEIVNRNKLMIAGLKANQAAAAARGIDEGAVTAMESAVSRIETLNKEQETLKGALKSKTAELEAAMNTLKTLYGDAKKTVKLAIEQPRWVEFGITDKH